MKRTGSLAAIVTIAVVLGGCNVSKKEANEQNLGAAINRALVTQGLMCLPATHWPATAALRPGDTPEITPEGLAALEGVGLAKSVETTMEVELTWGKVRKQPVKSYSLTDAARPYLHEGGQLCWGQKTVDHVVNWSEPSNNQSSILYVYRVSDVAAWANNESVQDAFPSIRAGLAGSGKNQSHCTADMTRNGWQADCPVT